jgi:hypothetical protein
MVPRAGIEAATRGFSTSLGNISGRFELLQTGTQLHKLESKILVLVYSTRFKSFRLVSVKQPHLRHPGDTQVGEADFWHA